MFNILLKHVDFNCTLIKFQFCSYRSFPPRIFFYTYIYPPAICYSTTVVICALISFFPSQLVLIAGQNKPIPRQRCQHLAIRSPVCYYASILIRVCVCYWLLLSIYYCIDGLFVLCEEKWRGIDDDIIFFLPLQYL